MAFQTPILITNFKCYQESTGARAVELAKLHERVANELGVNVAVVGMSLDLPMLAMSVSIPVLAQHLDGVGWGAFTGLVPVEVARSVGIDGAMLNHSERRISDSDIERALERMKAQNMLSLVCAETLEEGAKFAAMGADFIAIEVPELIGGDVSVSTAKPELISEAVVKIGAGKVIVGAGIKTAEDVRKALSLGAAGVLVASGIVKAADQLATLRELCGALKS
ncbi:triose-phosphate isomerase [Candidatus Peregrinibacteria bacterium RIFCSPLOWO2_01_FULL_48_20]|nr:MAG: triose-phosphate isomerase [Candidatus Peregrinibacteria bacterium RIFCSPLOWO2_01_FULL_48_20]